MASRGERPRRVGQLLRLELAHPPCSLLPNRVEERRRTMASRGERPRRVGQVLRVKGAHPPCRLLRNCIHEGMGRATSRGERPRRVGQLLRLELEPTRQRRRLDLLPETPPRLATKVQLCHGMRSIRQFAGAKLQHPVRRLLSQGCESCAVVALESVAVRGAHFSQPASAGGEIDLIECLAILRTQIQQLPRTRRFADE